MPRFQKTRLHPATAVLLLLVVYALGGLAYAAWMHSTESVAIWAIIAGLALVASIAYQRYVAARRRRDS